MKLTRLSLIAAMVLGGLVAFSSTAPAAQKEAKKEAKQEARQANQGARQNTLEAWSKRLELTEQQQKDIKPAWDKRVEAAKALREKNLDRTELAKERQKINKAFNEAIAKVLTPEQKKKMEELRKSGTARGRRAQ